MDNKQEKKPINLPENIPTDYAFDRMVKDFLKQVERSGILKELRDRRYYSKPSEIRHKIEGSIERKKVLQRRKRRKK